MNATIARHTILPWHRRHHHYAYADVYRIGVRYFASTIPLLRDNGNGNGGINNICLRQHQRQPLLPIATFIDLDTIAPKTIRRSDARAIIGPLIEFERRVNQQHHVGEKNDLSKSGSLLKVEAFGNIKSIINKHKYGNGNGNNGHATMDNNNNGPEPMTAFTGSLRSMAPEVIKRSYGFAKKMTILTDNTNSGTIYCSVCTCKLTLTDSEHKKEDDPKYTLLDKYKAHMQLHGKEQEKLIHKMHARQRIHKKKQHNSHNSNSSTSTKKRNRKKIKNILTPKEMNRYYKYKRAREELNLIVQLLKTNTGSNNGNTSNNGKQYQQQRLASSPNNKLKVVSRDESFNTLRDFGIKVHAVRRDVNEALVSAADGWMTDVFVQSGGNCGGNGVGNDIRSTHSSGNHATISDNNSTNTMEESENRKKDTNKHCYNGVLIVYSKDSIALAPLFQRAKDRGILTVSACNEVTNNNSNNSNHSASPSYISSSRSDDVVDIQLGPFGKWVEDDVVTTATPLDIDYFSSSLSDDGSSTTSLQHSSIKECSNNENDDGDGDGDEEGYIVKTVQSAPISLLLSSSPNKTSKKKQAKRHAMGAYAAIPVSDNGLRFMNERIEGGKEHDYGTLPTAAAAWLLAPSVPTSALNSILKNHHDDTMGQQQQHGSIGESFFARAMNAVTGMFHTFTSNVASSANIFASVNTTPPIEEEKNDAPSQLYSNKREEEDHETRSTKFYKCLRCGHQEEKWHRFNEFRKVECTRCSRRVRSLPSHKFVVYSPENNNAENDDDDASPFATGAERRKSTQRRYNNNNRRPMNKRGGSTRQRRPLMGGSGMFVPYLYRQTNKP